ncbi:MAG: helix-turn-helix domain-containing protein [Methylococcaceae bacterium]|nr:helix-turn-helix domain-containing protein [Methylococcaceae bacterium]
MPLAQLLIGFSVFSILIFIINSLLKSTLKNSDCSTRAGALLLFALLILQLIHGDYLQSASDSINHPAYKLALFTIAPAFYFYSRGILTLERNYPTSQLLHFAPLIIAPFLSLDNALPLAFLIGSVYLLWLTFKVYRLKEQRKRFKWELIALASLFVIALLVINLVLLRTIIGEQTFFNLYAVLIGLALFVALLADLHFPMFSADIAEAVQITYAESTLTSVDCEKTLTQLTKLLEVDKVYRNESLNLTQLAQSLNLSSHQLSELINSHLHKSFSRYLREYRIAEAKQLLLSEPNSSVLSIGLAVGFTSQSNFYAAFSDIEGLPPAKYRKQNQLLNT